MKGTRKLNKWGSKGEKKPGSMGTIFDAGSSI